MEGIEHEGVAFAFVVAVRGTDRVWAEPLPRCGNVAAILEFDENLKHAFRIFEAGSRAPLVESTPELESSMPPLPGPNSPLIFFPPFGAPETGCFLLAATHKARASEWSPESRAMALLRVERHRSFGVWDIFTSSFLVSFGPGAS